MSGPRRAAGPLLVIALAAAALAALDASGQSFWQGLAINLAIFMILTVALTLLLPCIALAMASSVAL